MTWADGRKYVGGWCANEMHGAGVYKNAKGSRRRATWNMGKRDSEWKKVKSARQKEGGESF